MKKNFYIFGVVIVCLVILGAVLFLIFWKGGEKEGSVLNLNKEEKILVENFEECLEAGYPVLESYPRQCVADGKTFVEDIGNVLEKADLIVVDSPRPNEVVKSPLAIDGQARGYWFFEASFPVKLLDDEGNIIAYVPTQALDDWMTEDFVPFKAILEFEMPATGRGKLILEKDNPSGLPEHEDFLVIPIRFE